MLKIDFINRIIYFKNKVKYSIINTVFSLIMTLIKVFIQINERLNFSFHCLEVAEINDLTIFYYIRLILSMEIN